MNMFARFDENPAMTLRVIKETKRYGRTDVKTVYPLQTKFARGIIKNFSSLCESCIMLGLEYSLCTVDGIRPWTLSLSDEVKSIC